MYLSNIFQCFFLGCNEHKKWDGEYDNHSININSNNFNNTCSSIIIFNEK